jgi:tetratricopeptide (TPR) repeat protein
MMGRTEESDIQGKRALEIDPFNPFTLTLYATQRMLTGRYEEAIREYEKAPPNPLAANGLAAANFKLGKMEEALCHFSQRQAMLGDKQLADVLTGPGEPTHRLHQAADILAERSLTQFVKPIELTFMYDWAGNLDEACKWLERGYELRDHDIAYLATLAFTDHFRADPRFKEMLRRVNLPVRD